MADFAPNFTSRFKLQYQASGKSHEMMFRYGRAAGAPPNELLTGVDGFLQALTPALVSDFAILGGSYSVFDTNFYLPFDPALNVVGLNGQGPSQGITPNNANFQGLTSLGNRASVYVYGFIFETLDNAPSGALNFRLTRAESVVVGAALDALADLEGVATGADNRNIVAWKQYANLNVNAYYQRKQRG